MTNARQSTKFGIDAQNGRLVLGNIRIPMPRSKYGRIGIGIALMIGGVLGFLPILGFWMLPLGVLLLSHDIPFIRRFRRRMACRWERRRRAKRERTDQPPLKNDARP